MPAFCHLHCHTSYSLLDGAARTDALVQRAAELGMKALGITDHGNLYGVPEFYTAARRAGVRPVIGCEFYLTSRSRHDRKDRVRFHQVLWAKSEAGYHNLVQLSSLSFLEGFYYKPRIDHELLQKYREGLVATTCCLQGEVPQTLLRKGDDAAREVFERYLDLFGEDYYIELQNHGIEDQAKINAVLLEWAQRYGVRTVATNDVHYVAQADAAAQDILLCLQTGRDLDDPSRLRFDSDQYYLKSADEMQQVMEAVDPRIASESLDAAGEIADKCSFELKMEGLLMPHFALPAGFDGDADAYLRHLVYAGAKRRYGELSSDIAARLDHELGIISTMGYAGYFLIVQDFTRAARELAVAVGPGRGSAAGSAVAYSLGITNIDPLQYDLLFERFLNPERVDMPDIDIDFDDRGRAAVIDYVVQKYGRNNVCQIVTFGTMAARSVIRDVARVLRLPLAEADRIAKLIPEGPGISLASAMESVPEFGALRDDPRSQIQQLLQYAQVLEGSVRHTGVHAAGVIIAPGTVHDYIPVASTKNKGVQVLTTQYDGTWVEKFGLLKMDFLGLSTLTVLKDTIALVREHRGIGVELDDIPLDDAKTYQLFQRGDTMGIFQFESEGMRDWLTKLVPTRMDDLIAMNALYRPGPMNLIPKYIDRKHGREEISYGHPMLEPVLRDTYGIPVYQEQVMQMAQVMAGYTLGGADLLRRAMGKKKQEEMDRQRDIFVQGASERGVDEATANKVFDTMATFAGYGFNKCLAGCTVVTDATTGASTSLESLFQIGCKGFTIHALGTYGRLHTRRVTDIVWNGYRKVFALATAGGRRIRATATHRFRARTGWKRLAELRPGDRIAAANDLATVHITGHAAERGRAHGHRAVVDTRLGADTLNWDTIESIQEAGRADTYDLTVEGDHNFVANGLFVHNSHSAAYSLVAYHAAYFKANYPAEFMAAAMTNIMADSRKLALMLDEARKLDLELLPPSVNSSHGPFTVDTGKIRFGMCAVKGVGQGAAQAIADARKENGPAQTLFGFTRHLDLRAVSKKALECLARVGALDDLDGHRSQFVEAIDAATQYALQEQADAAAGQNSLFGDSSVFGATTEPRLPKLEPWGRARLLKEERGLIGLYISGHPLDAYRPETASFATATLGDTSIAATNGANGPKPQHTFCAIITDVQQRTTRKGAPMAVVTLEDFAGQAEMLCFSAVFDKVQQYLHVDEIVLARGEVESRGGSLRILARDVIPMWKVREQMVKSIVVQIHPNTVGLQQIEAFREICDANRGTCRLYFDVVDPQLPEGRQRLRSRVFVVEPNPDLMSGVAKLFGASNIILEGLS